MRSNLSPSFYIKAFNPSPLFLLVSSSLSAAPFHFFISLLSTSHTTHHCLLSPSFSPWLLRRRRHLVCSCLPSISADGRRHFALPREHIADPTFIPDLPPTVSLPPLFFSTQPATPFFRRKHSWLRRGMLTRRFLIRR